jgi:hypothetical protein
MAALLRPWSLIGLFLAALGLTGCNVLSLPFFIFGPEPTIEAQLRKVASDDKKKEVKVAILTYSGLGLPTEFIRADRDLSERLRAQLKASFEYNKEKVTVVGSRRVEAFKNENPGWHTMDLDEVGKQLGADYVIYLEIRHLSLYEKGSGSTIYRGRADISVSLVDVNDGEEGPLRREFTTQFPTEARQGIPVDGDVNLQKFKDSFLDYVAQRLSWYFTSHPRRLEHDCE